MSTSDKAGYVNFYVALVLTVLLAAFVALRPATATAPPNVVFVLLDATRADRFSAWGNPHRTTPWLDGLGAQGVIFLEHFANANATRPSMPQLMTGRYYHQSILRAFTPDAHPREFPFSAPDPTAVLLPEALRQRGYRTAAVSAHPWAIPESDFGHHFDRFDTIAPVGKRPYAEAPAVADGAIKAWQERDRTAPLFLYVHFMDMHQPRTLPEGEPRFPVAGYDWRSRFDDKSNPLFHPPRRKWERHDARDFTELDRRHFEAVYDTRLAYTDEQLGRLLTALRADDPNLEHTLVVVVADHGDELGEDGRILHGDSLADGVQHIPWILAGAGVQPGQQARRFTEQIDVTPTILAVAGVSQPAGVQMDGRPQVTPEGVLCSECQKAAVYYAWEDYRAIRTGRYLLRQHAPGSLLARCDGDELLYRVDRPRRVRLDPTGRYRPVADRLRARIERRLGRREREFRARRYGPPHIPFQVPLDYWEVGSGTLVACVPMDGTTKRDEMGVRGWLWSGHGLTVLAPDGDHPLPVTVRVPPGKYRVDLATVPVDRMPWFFGFEEWRRKSFLPDDPSSYIPLGAFESQADALSVSIPAALGTGQHILRLRFSPADGAAAPEATTPTDPELQQRLRALGYVQ